VKGVYYVAPGAVSRGTLRETELHRKPACALITIEGKTVTFKNVVIPHRPGPEVLDDQAVIRHPDVESDEVGMEDCIEMLQAMEENEDATLGPLDILKLVRQNMIVSDAAYELAVAKLQEREE
jgi:hypothetical protein